MNDWYYIYTNWQATNFRLMKVHKDQLGDKKHWQDVIPANDQVKLESYTLFNDYLVYQQREQGISCITIEQLSTGKKQRLNFNDSAYTVELYGNNDINNKTLRLYYTSFTTPGTHYDIDLATTDKTQLKQTKASSKVFKYSEKASNLS